MSTAENVPGKGNQEQGPGKGNNEQIHWDLNDLYSSPSSPAIEEDLRWCHEQAQQFERDYRGLCTQAEGPSASKLLEAIQALEAICERVSKLGAYAGLLTSVDNQSPTKRALEDKVDQQSVEIMNLLAFFDIEWLQVADEVASRLIDDPLLKNYSHYLQATRRYKPHTKTEPEELILNQKHLTARNAWVSLFDEFMSSLSYRFAVEGKVESLTQSQLLAFSYHPDRNLRKSAQVTLYQELSQHQIVLTNILNAVAQDHSLNDSIRGYPHPMASRHLTNEVPGEVIERMQQVTEQNQSLGAKYYQLKARLLGLEKMATYDQYAPIFAEMPTCTYEYGKKTVLEAFARFHPETEQVARRFFDEHWIDAEVRPGKRGGAFSASTVPSVHPYIMLNWTDKIRDLSTMAHELGHGIHQYLSRAQSYLNFHHPLTIAETASVFAEFLTFDHLMKTETNPQIRLQLVCAKIEDAFATVFRQNILTRFEQATHAARRQERLSADQICQIWWDANHSYYADSVEMLPDYRWGWSYIPHFIHTPFYCYAYVFGELLVLALYQMYKEQGADFVPGYLELLRSGSILPPADLIQRLGVDIRDTNFWQRGFNVLGSLVDQAWSLAKETGRI